MKKIIVIALSALVSACACFDCADENERNVAYQTVSKDKTLDCDYFDGKTCYRYIFKNIQRQAPKPAPVYYHKPAPVVHHTPCDCMQRPVAPVVVKDDNGCQEKVSETREPVELVYKKVTTKTTYEPKTTSQVSYEKVPYKSVTVTQPEPVEVVVPSNTTTTVIEEIK